MKQTRGLSIMMGLVALGIVFAMTACTTGYTPKNAPESFACVPDQALEKDISPEAELAELTCFFKKYEGMETLHFKVGVKNVSSNDQRYRVNLFLDNGKAVGGLIPRKTKKGLVKPGTTATFVYPVSQMPRQPKSVLLRIRTVSK
ncbi:MAG: hypothetical protein JRI76_12990 [Deltaproteobacteria bacterium]|nr:hypothetical protein [Deltaproteobacteria bacterium]MBW1955360.1 hypothetical protein [Deltaproteobacteria bacterium]MBW2042922.1 hypothetical protein [Deltaproteobacteria bacterium]MBW2132989.1 hypothetical protein [Deltaproteobacteria bacterium]